MVKLKVLHKIIGSTFTFEKGTELSIYAFNDETVTVFNDGMNDDISFSDLFNKCICLEAVSE